MQFEDDVDGSSETLKKNVLVWLNASQSNR